MGVKFWTHWVDVKVGVFPVIRGCYWHSVQTFSALIPNGWQVHVCLLLSDFNALEFGIVEVIGVINVFNFRGVKILLQVSKLILAILRLHFCFELGNRGMVKAFIVVAVNSSSSCLREVLSVQIFTAYLRDESCVAWDVLGFKSICWSTDPSISFS